MSEIDEVRRIVFVHAHPDDESSKGAATASRYVDEGARVVLVTCTGGEAGEVLNPSFPEISEEEMVEVRRRELKAACEVIGFTSCYGLEFEDSGYHEDPAGVPEGTFARLSVDVTAPPLARILREERPHVVVTYPEDGGYPHPDHVMCHEVTMRAIDIAEDPDADVPGEPWRVPKVYACHAFPPERVLAIHEALIDRGMESPFEGWMERRAEREAPTWPCDARVVVADWFERRDEALRCHASQVDPDGMWFGWPRDVEREVFPWECFSSLRSDVEVAAPEEDLFAGLIQTDEG